MTANIMIPTKSGASVPSVKSSVSRLPAHVFLNALALSAFRFSFLFFSVGWLIQVAIKTMLKKYLFSDAEKASVEREIEIQQVRPVSWNRPNRRDDVRSRTHRGCGSRFRLYEEQRLDYLPRSCLLSVSGSGGVFLCRRSA